MADNLIERLDYAKQWIRNATKVLATLRDRLAEAERERDEWKRRHFQMRDERDKANIAKSNYAEFSREWRQRAETAERQRDEMLEAQQDGMRPLPMDRDTLGRMVREAWVRWANKQPNPKPSWLAPYDDLAEPDKEADRQIGEAIARLTLIHEAARAAQEPER